jgi:leucyl aminopeptidase
LDPSDFDVGFAPSGSRVSHRGTSRSRLVPLVGKSVAYDFGGYSIKPDGGKGMRADKAGACTMPGVMEAIDLKKLPLHVSTCWQICRNPSDRDISEITSSGDE